MVGEHDLLIACAFRVPLSLLVITSAREVEREQAGEQLLSVDVGRSAVSALSRCRNEVARHSAASAERLSSLDEGFRGRPLMRLEIYVAVSTLLPAITGMETMPRGHLDATAFVQRWMLDEGDKAGCHEAARAN
jgi:hypothetical protein